MSQSAVFVKLESEKNEAVIIESCVPDEDTLKSLALGEEMFGEITATYLWFDIGEGESGLDVYFSDKELEEMYKDEILESQCQKKGYEVSLIERGTVSIFLNSEEE